MTGAHQRQLRKVDQHTIEVGRGLFLVAFAPVFDAFGHFGEHLRNHDAQHRFAQTGHQHRGEIEQVPANVQVTGQAFEAGAGVFIVGRHRDASGIGDGLVSALNEQCHPQVARDLIGNGLCIGILDRRFTPPWPHVQWLALLPGKRLQTFVDPAEKQPLVLLRHEPAEKRLVLRVSQLTDQGFHERGQRGVLLERMLRIIRYIGDHVAGQTTLMVDVVAAQKLIVEPLRPIGEKRLQQFEPLVLRTRQYREALRPFAPELH
ncbi:hypothetical protein D3C76_392790 [compost metagenome]